MKTLLLSLALLFISLVSAAQHYVISPAREVTMPPTFEQIVTDLLGNTLIKKSVTNETIRLNVSDLSTGYYLIQCKYGNETAGMKKLCITK